MKALFFLPLLALIAAPAYALTVINAQPTTSCDVTGYCETTVDLGKFLNAPAISMVKATNYSKSIETIENETSLRNMGYKFINNSMVFYGRTIENTYWTIDLRNGFSIDPWWNLTWTKCKNLTITQYGISNVAAVNITGLTMNNSYEGRIINNSCNATGSEINFTVKSSLTDSPGNDWVDIEFKSEGNVTWGFYYDYPLAPNPGYYFLLFNPNMTALSISASTDTAYDWHSDDTAKYSVQGGFLNMTDIDASAQDSDQIQTQTNFSPYGNVTVYIENYLTASAGADESYSRFYAATKTHGLWNNYYNNIWLNNQNYRIGSNHDTLLNVSNNNPAVQYQKNVSWKIFYSPNRNYTEMYLYNSTDYQLWNVNVSTLNTTLAYWGSWTDNGESDIWYYIYKIYFGFVNPTLTNQPSVVVGNEQIPPAAPPTPTVKDNTVICFQTQPVCINLKDSSLIYKGSGVYG